MTGGAGTGRQAAIGYQANALAGKLPVAPTRLPRVFIVQTFYPEFLKGLYALSPELAEASFDVQCARLFGSAFSTSDAYSHNLRALGCEAWEVICNADAAQARWAKDHAMEPTGNVHERRRAIVAAQVERFRPDVVYVFEWSPLGDEFVASLRAPGRLVVGEIASPLPADRTFRGYDLMISSWPPIVDYFRSIGIDAEHVRLGFDERILATLPPVSPRFDVSFVGGFAASHPDRIAWLEEILGEVPVDVFCYGLERTSADSPIRKHFRGEAWGWEMYRTLQASKITLNRHARLDVRGAVDTSWVNNMRMYEATGVGTCLFTERRPHLDKLFVPDVEVVTYGDTRECIEKIRYYLDHESERVAIAAAGQQRTLREHLYSHRMRELLDILARRRGEETPRTGEMLEGRNAESRNAEGDAGFKGSRVQGFNGSRGGRVGVWVSAKPSDGGVYQYSMTLLEQLHMLLGHAEELSMQAEDSPSFDVVLFASDVDDPALVRFAGPRWSVRACRPDWSPLPSMDLSVTPPLDSPIEQADMRAWFEECGVDLMVFPSPHRLSFECGLPFVMCVHDLQHVLQPEFPEVSAGGEWARREYVMRNAARTAALLIAESPVGREDILRSYERFGVSNERVKVLRYLPSVADPARGETSGSLQSRLGTDENATHKGWRYISSARFGEVRDKYSLPERYLFYPAQFWPHKNHLRIVEALGRLQSSHGLDIPLVLSGSSGGAIREATVAELRARVAALQLESRVHFLGYVPNAEIAALYTGAVALVMPTFFGPTNIPFLEAWGLGCPVITSRIRGIVEQVGDAALTVDPTSVAEIAEGIRRVWTDEELRASLIEGGRARLAEYSPRDFRARLRGILEEAVGAAMRHPIESDTLEAR